MRGQSPRVLVVQFQDDAPPAWMGEWLTEAGCVLDVRRPGVDALALDDVDGLLVLGGFPSSNDDVPSVVAAKDVVRRAAERSVPTLGICLGHQVCAVALGGEVAANPRGQQAGVLPVGWTAAARDDPLFGALTDVPGAVQWNDDVVTALPPGATLVAATEAGEVQAARFADTVWGVQWHPEADETITAGWAAADGGRHDPVVLEAAVSDVRSARSILEHDWRRLAAAFAALAAGPGNSPPTSTLDTP